MEARPTLLQRKVLRARIADLESALSKLAHEAQGFCSMADPAVHGSTNIAVLKLRIREAQETLQA